MTYPKTDNESEDKDTDLTNLISNELNDERILNIVASDITDQGSKIKVD